MNKTEVMRRLESLGTAQNRKIYARHGVVGAMFGVSYADQYKLRKEIGVDHELAEKLWATGNHDARVLATMIADPARLNARALTAWVKDVVSHVDAAALGGLMAKSPVAKACITKWAATKDEWKGATAWNALSWFAHDETSDLSDAEGEEFLRQIEARIHASKNRVRYSMNGALIGIGSRNAKLRKVALAAAKRIGKVEVDHGETSCKTPDAYSYIRKMADHAKKKKAKSAPKKKVRAKKAPAKKSASRVR